MELPTFIFLLLRLWTAWPPGRPCTAGRWLRTSALLGDAAPQSPLGHQLQEGSEGKRAHPMAAAAGATGRASWPLAVAPVFFIPSRTHGIWDSIDDHFGCLQGTTVGW